MPEKEPGSSPDSRIFQDFLSKSVVFQEFCDRGDQLVARVLSDPTFDSLTELDGVVLAESQKEEVSEGIMRNLTFLIKIERHNGSNGGSFPRGISTFGGRNY